MRAYRVTSPITLHTGVIGLSDRQAAGRANCLTLWPDGLYTVTMPVQFKAGEVISLEPEAVKGLGQFLAEVEPDVAPEAEATAAVAEVEPQAATETSAEVAVQKKKPGRKAAKVGK
jgi:hypothetical protein